AAQEHIGVLADICQGTGVSLLSVFGLGLFHVLFTAFVNDAARVGYIDVAARKSQADKKVQAGDGSGAGSRTNQLYARDVLADHLETVEDRSSRNDGRAVLVVVEDRNLHAFAKLLFDIEAFGSLDVFKIDPTQGGLQRRDDVDQLIRIVFVELDVKYINAGEFLEQASFALHDRLGGERADIAQAQHSGTVGNHTHQVGTRGVQRRGFVALVVDGHTGRGYTRRVGQRKVVLVGQRLGRRDRNLPRNGEGMIVECQF